MPTDAVEQRKAMCNKKPDFHVQLNARRGSISNYRDSLQSPTLSHTKHNGLHQPASSSHSDKSDRQLGHDSIENDRVFPVRSVISVDASQTPFLGPTQLVNEHDTFPGFGAAAVNADTQSKRNKSKPRTMSRDGTHRKASFGEDHKQHGKRASRDSTDRRSPTPHREIKGLSLFNDSSSRASGETTASQSLASSTSERRRRPTESFEAEDAYVTSRFKHILTEHGHAIVTGRDGTTLQRCEDEPIHIPGAVQSFGLLVALSEEPDGDLLVRIVSENSKRIIGFTPEQLFRLGSFTDILSEEQTDNLLDHVDFIRDEEADPATNGPEVFTLTIKPPKGRAVKLWCGMHINPANPELIICEFELDDDSEYPLVPPNQETPEPPGDTLDSQPTQEEFDESTHIESRPLRVLRSARKRRGEAAAMEVFNIMSQVQEQLANATSLEMFLKILVGVVKELTGFHRVMIYQFDNTFNGRVVTELVDPRATKDLYKGLNFPASDIPKQARDLYKINKVRLLYDRDLETARLVCRTIEDLEKPLDLSFSYLRAMSPIHIKYLANMAVRSSMSISINAFGELWGLIACHSYGSRGMRVSFPIRKMCRLIGDTASRNIERLSYASRLQARKLINTVPTEANPSGYIIASSEDLLKLFDADFGLLSIKGETKILGKLEQTQEALAMLEYLRLRCISSVITTLDIKQDFPDLHYTPGFKVIAGLLLVPLSASGTDFIVFFRKGQVKEVKWAGNPYEKFIRSGTEGYLEPRKSFKTWCETVTGKCRDWTEEQVETAAVLCLVYGKFIEVWRQKEAALQSSQLTRLLLSNSAHEVRTPLNAIINYLEIALEGSLDQETRENLAKSHSASKSLIYVINDLLDLTKTEEGQGLVKDEIFTLPDTIREAAEQFDGDASRKGLRYEIAIDDNIPNLVYGDHRRLRQAVSNLIANAMQHTTSGSIRVELYLVTLDDYEAVVEVSVEDTGCGMSSVQLDQLFGDLEQVSHDPDESPANASDDQQRPGNEAKDGSNEGSRALGLGLAVVARFVRNMDGQLRLKSNEGEGSRFVIQLKFTLPEDTAASEGTITDSNKSSASLAGKSSVRKPTSNGSTAQAGEMLLVDQASISKMDGLSRKRSIEDVASVKSMLSGHSSQSHMSHASKRSGKSDVDRMIEAISEPLSQSDQSESNGGRSNRRSFDGVLSRKNSLNASDRPGMIRHSSDTQREVRLAERTRRTGQGVSVEGVGTSLLAVRMPDEALEQPPSENAPQSVPPPSSHVASGQKISKSSPEPSSEGHLQVLVAEDDPINSKIIMKRLDKLGHKVYHTVNGEACASAFCEAPPLSFDVVLMDMQMPIVDGLTATKMIRSHEQVRGHEFLSSIGSIKDRIPIFAVSASLVERERQTYIDAGFDGWILKPIDFKRLNVLMNAISDDKLRKSCLYQPGKWEKGGWFHSRKSQQPAHDSLRREYGSISSTDSDLRGGDKTPVQSSQYRFGNSGIMVGDEAIDMSGESTFARDTTNKYTVEEPASPLQV